MLLDVEEFVLVQFHQIFDGFGIPEHGVNHRVIVGVTHPRVYVDHINHDGLDNRRVNLRVCSQAENQRNKVSKGGSSTYLGVSFQKSRPNLRRRWRAKIEHKGKAIELGYFASEEEAARARDIAAQELFGEFANLNL